MKRDRLYVGALMMPRRVQQFAHGFRFQKKFSIFLVDRHLAHSQQKALGIFEVNKLLQEIEQQHVKLIVRQFDMSCFARFNRIQIVDHHVHRRVGRGHEQFRQIASGRFERDVGSSDFFEIMVRHVENDN